MIYTIAIINWTYIARIIRGQVLSLREKEFREAARSLGASNRRIIFRELLPNLVAPLIVYSTLIIPTNLLFEASLSFLGVCVQAPLSCLGAMLSDASPILVSASVATAARRTSNSRRSASNFARRSRVTASRAWPRKCAASISPQSRGELALSPVEIIQPNGQAGSARQPAQVGERRAGGLVEGRPVLGDVGLASPALQSVEEGGARALRVVGEARALGQERRGHIRKEAYGCADPLHEKKAGRAGNSDQQRQPEKREHQFRFESHPGEDPKDGKAHDGSPNSGETGMGGESGTGNARAAWRRSLTEA